MNDFRSIYAIRAKSIKQVIQSIDFRKKYVRQFLKLLPWRLRQIR